MKGYWLLINSRVSVELRTENLSVQNEKKSFSTFDVTTFEFEFVDSRMGKQGPSKQRIVAILEVLQIAFVCPRSTPLGAFK